MLPYLLILFFIFCGCEQKPQVRHYTEMMIEVAPLPRMTADPHAGIDMEMATPMPTANDAVGSKIAWDVPAGWQQEAGNSMRLATFHLASDPKAFDCSIVSLGGMAGGIEANLSRWMKQINLETSEEEFSQFLRSAQALKTKTGKAIALYDFTHLQKDADGKMPSILAAVLYLGDATVFVKLSGSIDALKTNRQQFIKLTESVRDN